VNIATGPTADIAGAESEKEGCGVPGSSVPLHPLSAGNMAAHAL
jgi:hypothetical protein